MKGLFKGFRKEDLIMMKPKMLIDILATSLAITNTAFEAMNEEMKQMRKELAELKGETKKG